MACPMMPAPMTAMFSAMSRPAAARSHVRLPGPRCHHGAASMSSLMARFMRRGRLQRCQLAVEQRGRHEVALAGRNPSLPAVRGVPCKKMNKTGLPAAAAMCSPIGTSSAPNKWRQCPRRCSASPIAVEPRPAVIIGQRNAGRHLCDVGAGMQGVALDEGHAKLGRQGLAD